MGKIKTISEIYLTFVKLGSVSFGGGYAMLSLMEREVVDQKKWIEKEKIVDIFAVSESLPGAIALNSSSFVGYSIAGIPGAIAALLGNLTPSIIIMAVLSVLLTQFSGNLYVEKAFNGIRPVIVGLIAYAALKIGRTGIKDKFCLVIAVLAFVMSLIFHISVIFIIAGGIVFGLLMSIIKHLSIKKDQAKNKQEGA